jgi:hypothetical protein
MLQARLNRAHGFSYQLFNLVHHLVCFHVPIIKVILNPLKDRGKRSLVTSVCIIKSFVELKLPFVFAVD